MGAHGTVCAILFECLNMEHLCHILERNSRSTEHEPRWCAVGLRVDCSTARRVRWKQNSSPQNHRDRSGNGVGDPEDAITKNHIWLCHG